MPTETDIRLRSWLDGNQRDREQMCRAVLALDPHYTDVRPRHPTGGPDGGRDIEAVYDGDRTAFGAVGFQNSANDSAEQKKNIRAKYSSDLASALAARPELKVFAFLTNLHLTMGEQTDMKDEARRLGIEHCDILDRERLRIELDSPSGFFIRFQYLAIPLSGAEQTSFLARYGDRIQEIVSTGFHRIEQSLDRILFLQEAADLLETLTVRFELKRTYAADEIGHFRAFASVLLHYPANNLAMIWFGSSDKSSRFSVRGKEDDQPAGIAYGISGGQWELDVPSSKDIGRRAKKKKAENRRRFGEKGFVLTTFSGEPGTNSVSSITIGYSQYDIFYQRRPRLRLRDLDQCSLSPTVNQSLAEKLHSIHVFANGYKLAEIGPDDFTIVESSSEGFAPEAFSSDEIADQWVAINPTYWMVSGFKLKFSSRAPRRLFDHEQMLEKRSNRPT